MNVSLVPIIMIRSCRATSKSHNGGLSIYLIYSLLMTIFQKFTTVFLSENFTKSRLYTPDYSPSGYDYHIVSRILSSKSHNFRKERSQSTYFIRYL